MNNIDVALICKALSDSNRIEIVKILSKEEKCACKILERLDITQPTLSHNMKILIDCNLVQYRKEGKWTHYNLNLDTFEAYRNYIDNILESED